MKFESRIDLSEFRAKIRKEEQNVIVRAQRIAKLVAQEVINHARSHSGEMKEGAAINAAGNYVPKSQRTPRRAHPGGWADVTSNLAGSIKHSMVTNGFRVESVVEATMEYAEALDALTGYDVLGGADEIVRKALKKHGRDLFR